MKLPRIALALLLASSACSAPEPPPPLDQGLFERIAVIGASSSAGFNLQLETGFPVRLADFLDLAIAVPHAIVFDGASALLFMAPEAMGGQMAVGARAASPSLLIAPDFLFWFFYGAGSTAELRRERLEGGLALLEDFDCPLVIGDLPFMQDAAGGMIPHASMPPAGSFAGANERIYAWAAERGNVAVVPFVELNAQLRSGEAYTVGGFTWDPAELGGLLQPDHLHPNMAGSAILALEILQSLAHQRGATLDGLILGDPEELVDAVDDLVSARN